MRSRTSDASKLLETERLVKQGYEVFIDRHLAVGVEWAKEIERQIRTADAVIPLLSAASITSEMIAYEVQIAHEAAQQQEGKPRLLPVRVDFKGALPDPLSSVLAPLQYALWSGAEDDDRLAEELLSSLHAPEPPKPATNVEPPGGAVPLDSRFYLVRPTDEQFLDAIGGVTASCWSRGRGRWARLRCWREGCNWRGLPRQKSSPRIFRSSTRATWRRSSLSS